MIQSNFNKSYLNATRISKIFKNTLVRLDRFHLIVVNHTHRNLELPELSEDLFIIFILQKSLFYYKFTLLSQTLFLG